MSPDAPPPAGTAGVNLAGYLDATLGLGEAARQVRAALELGGVLVAPLSIRHPTAPSQTTAPSAPQGAPHPVTLVCTTPDGMRVAADQLGRQVFDGRRVIGMWWWEVDALPGRWLRGFDDVDEVWAGSRFVADVLAPRSPVPVIRMPLPVAEPPVADVTRSDLGLPDGFVFGFVFDHASTDGRKNPVGLIDAFARAFPDAGGDEHLVLKTFGADTHASAHESLMAAAATHPRVHVIDRQLDAEAKNALIKALDCYVSLHRAEGFGLTLAEAMLLGTPVAATDYGGSRDFLTAFNGWPVDYRMTSIGPRHDPYPADGTWAEPDVDHAAAVLREIRAHPDEAARRAARAAADVRREHAPARAGAEMAARLLRLSGLPRTADGRPEPLDLGDVERRVREGVAPAPATGRLRSVARSAVLRLLQPHAVQQRLVNEELLRALRGLDERVRGVATGQSALAAELRRLRAAEPPADAVPPSSEA